MILVRVGSECLRLLILFWMVLMTVLLRLLMTRRLLVELLVLFLMFLVSLVAYVLRGRLLRLIVVIVNR